MSSRDLVLGSVRKAIAGAPSPEVRRTYVSDLGLNRASLIALLAERIQDYQAEVRVVPRADLARTIGSVLAGHAATSVVVPDDLEPDWLTTVTCEVIRDDPSVDARRLDSVSAVITSSTVSIALTGTIVLDGGAGQGRRIISLIPDLHICVVSADSVVGTVPEAMPRLNPRLPLTWISGPSATSDIELDRVEGVHGPRTLIVLILEESA